MSILKSQQCFKREGKKDDKLSWAIRVKYREGCSLSTSDILLELTYIFMKHPSDPSSVFAVDFPAGKIMC